MSSMFFLLPIALAMGSMGLVAFFWCMKSGQFEDLDGDALRILFDDEDGEATSAPQEPKS